MFKQKLFFGKKKFKLFLAPGDEGNVITRRVVRMGGTIWLEQDPNPPDYSNHHYIQSFEETHL